MTRYAICSLALVVVMLLSAGTAHAGGVTVDGRVLPSESYYSWEIQSSTTYKSGPKTGEYIKADFYLAQDPNTFDVFAAVVLPKDWIDNSYGANQVGWGAYSYTGYNHTFSNLHYDDNAYFVARNGPLADDRVLKATFDYTYQEDSSDAFGSGFDNGGGSVTIGSESDILAAASSLDYNLNEVIGFDGDYVEGGRDYTVDSPETDGPNTYEGSDVAGWVFDVVYEFKVDGDVFGEMIINDDGFIDDWKFVVTGVKHCTFKDGCSSTLCFSPPSGKPKPPGTIPPAGVVPLPTGVWAGLILICGLGLVRMSRRRRMTALRS